MASRVTALPPLTWTEILPSLPWHRRAETGQKLNMLGEIPITSYFARLPPSKKRKQNPQVTSASTAQKRPRINEAEIPVVRKKEIQGNRAFPEPRDNRKTKPAPQERGMSAIIPHDFAHRPESPRPEKLKGAATNDFPYSKIHDSPKHEVSKIPLYSPAPMKSRHLRSPSVGNQTDPLLSCTSRILVDGTSGITRLPQHRSTSPAGSGVLEGLDTAGGKAVAFVSSPTLLGPCSTSSSRSQRKKASYGRDAAIWDDVPDENDGRDSESTSSIVPSSQSQDISSSHFTSPSSSTLPARSSPSTPGSLGGSLSDGPVPSSQSQYFFPYQSSPRRRHHASSSIDSVPSSQSQYISPTAQHDDDGFVVPSSQSQWLFPLDLGSEGNEKPSLIPDVAIGVTDDDPIPSSQAEFELELRPRSERELAGQRHERCEEPDHSSSFGGNSQETFALLVLDVADMFEDCTDAPSVTVPLRDDSATESDSDDVDGEYTGKPQAVSAASSPHLSDEDASMNPGLDDKPNYAGDSLCAPDVGSSAASSGNSLGSLPDVVQEFYDMFGTGDGSYPDDFPQSLKWNGEGTQTQT
ncbi:hypothetical protein B0H10DRAFT_2429412, partial [Mycena sp. CBHHK59/15]